MGPAEPTPNDHPSRYKTSPRDDGLQRMLPIDPAPTPAVFLKKKEQEQLKALLLPMQSRRPPVQEVCGYHDGRIGEARETGNSRPWPLARSKQVENLRPRRAANRWSCIVSQGLVLQRLLEPLVEAGTKCNAGAKWQRMVEF